MGAPHTSLPGACLFCLCLLASSVTSHPEQAKKKGPSACMPCTIAHAALGSLPLRPLPRHGRPGGQVHGPRPKSLATYAPLLLCLLATGRASSSLRCGARLVHRRRCWALAARTHSSTLFANHRRIRLRVRGQDRTGMHVWRQTTKGSNVCFENKFATQHLELWVVLEDRSRSLNRFLSGSHLLSEPQSQRCSSSNRQTRPLRL